MKERPFDIVRSPFTPGPWIAHAMHHAHGEMWLQVSQRLPDGSKRGPICRPASPAEPLSNGALAEIKYMATPEDNQRANARLMAAAPDLLDACTRTLEILDAWGPERRGDTLERLRERVGSAIERAMTPTTAECPLSTF